MENQQHRLWQKDLKVLYLEDFKSIKALKIHLNPEWFSLIVIVSGTITFKDSSSTIFLPASALYTIPVSAKVWAVAAPLQICLISCTMDFATQNRVTRFGNAFMKTLTNRSPFVISLTESELKDIVRLFGLLKKKASRQPSIFQAEIVVLCVNLILCEYCDLSQKYGGNIAVVHGRSEKIVIGFITLVENHCKEHHDVKFYADALFVTEGHLRKVVRVVIGKSAKHFIEMAIISEAYLLLADSNLSITEIAEELNFSNSQSFSGFFKRHTTLSPTRYRLTLYFN
ncbi:helix-turn-helix domain-containing protein [Flavobacterium pectinovorum]|uniref:helix-turn-helix domain-containing protein n=1 Tax=Flavobacterium pectinovorum TaxID=29533 RepID=UPI0013564FF4|nr:helix-turn-helix domain-containing protein [Flavobacterium pectinovorum]